MSAEIEPIHGDINWGADAAAGDALNRVNSKSAFIAVWIDPEKGLKWSKANTDFAALSMFAAVLAEMAQTCARIEIERE